MNELIAASLLAAVPARGRFAGERQARPSYPRYRKVAQTDPAGPRAERRAAASPSVRPPRLIKAGRAVVARLRAQVARRELERRERLAGLIAEAAAGAQAAAELRAELVNGRAAA
jgi:hypothetical protein